MEWELKCHARYQAHLAHTYAPSRIIDMTDQYQSAFAANHDTYFGIQALS